MRYKINVEFEYTTYEDPIDTIHKILRPIVLPEGRADHYHLLSLPRVLDEDNDPDWNRRRIYPTERRYDA